MTIPAMRTRYRSRKRAIGLLSTMAVVLTGLHLLTPVAQAQTLELRERDGGVTVLDAGALARLHQQDLALDDHGTQARYRGVPLVEIARLGGAPTGDTMRGADALSTVLVIRAADGYRVVLPVSDVDPSVRKDGAILALTKDGRPLEAHEGPLRAIVGGDVRPARSARQVIAIEVRTIE